jgi:hypothetical protein
MTVWAGGQGIDEELDAVLRADRAGHSAQDRGKDRSVGEGPPADITKKERDRVPGEAAEIVHR